MKSTEEIRSQLEDTLLVLVDFWEADYKSQQAALEMSCNCIKAVLKFLEDKK